MQEIKMDGTPGKRIEGDITDLLEKAVESLEDPEVQSVVIRKMIPGRNARKQQINIKKDRIRQIVREELKIMLMQRDPLFEKIMAELKED